MNFKITKKGDITSSLHNISPKKVIFKPITIMNGTIPKKTYLNPATTIDAETGEVYDNGTTRRITLEEETTLIPMNYKSFFSMSDNAVEYVLKNFTFTESGRILSLANMTKGKYAILYSKENMPHDAKTLAFELELSCNKFKNFIDKLFLKSIVSYYIVFKKGKKYKHYVLNPTMCKNGKVFEKEVIDIFEDLRIIKTE